LRSILGAKSIAGLMDLDTNRTLIVAALARIPAGDRAALQTVYRLTSAKLFGVCLRILGERSEAEEVLQEVYVTVWRKAADFDAGRASPLTWLIAIARNRSIDRLRASKQSRRMEPIEAADSIADAGPMADVALENAQDYAKLHGCLDGLEARERSALRGAFFDGNTYEELAARMNVPLGTMKSWIRRAMIKLKGCLQQ
jgi:RNA polymerase sigma-70 factor (ECF subfamily)